MKSPLYGLLVLTVLGAAPRVPAQVAADGDGYRIKLKYVAGQKMRYSATTDVVVSGGPAEMPPPPPKMEMTVEQEVIKVEDGIATVKVTMTGAPEGTPPEQTFQIDEHGKTTGGESSPMAGFSSGFPDRALKNGEEWSAESDVPGAENGEKAKTDYKFVGLVQVEGKTLAQIDFKSVVAGEVQAESGGTVYLDPADGQTVSMKTVTKMTMNIPGLDTPMTIEITMEMKRL